MYSGFRFQGPGLQQEILEEGTGIKEVTKKWRNDKNGETATLFGVYSIWGSGSGGFRK